MIARMALVPALLMSLMATASAASPVGRWTAVEIAGLPVARGVETTFELGSDGRVSGRGGCNRYGGEARLGDGTIGFGPLMATEMACPRPEMDQESRFFQAMAKVATWRIDGARLVLADAGGRALAVFQPARVGG